MAPQALPPVPDFRRGVSNFERFRLGGEVAGKLSTGPSASLLTPAPHDFASQSINRREAEAERFWEGKPRK